MAPWLQRHGHDVTGLDTDFYFDGNPQPPLESHRRISKDIRETTLADFQGFVAVVHLAALSNAPLGDLKPELTFDINFRASVTWPNLPRKRACSASYLLRRAVFTARRATRF